MIKLFFEYRAITRYYGDKTAQRSGVPLINHIEEGLIILDAIGASLDAKRAYCIHPLLQSDEALKETYNAYDASYLGLSTKAVLLALEYRKTANAYLSYRDITSLDEIELSPLKDVNDMLIADKVQNRKDFDIHHKGTHPNSERLTQYFDNWLVRLEVADKYDELIKLIS